jgi:hypothetical protein
MSLGGSNPRNMHDVDAGSGSGTAVVAPTAADAENTTGPKNQLFLGTFIHSKTREDLEYLHDAAIFVDGKGTIIAVEKECDLRKAEEEVYPKLSWTARTTTVHSCKEGQFFFPGFIGEHIYMTSPPPSLSDADPVCQTPTSTQASIPMSASSENQPSSTG